jgi:hypothetical protein
MMTVGLHCRLARPARVAAIQEFLDYAKSYGRDVWICTREEIANHWYEHHLPRGIGSPINPATLPSGTSSAASRFSFLGNLNVPRDQQGVLSPPPKLAATSEDGDII